MSALAIDRATGTTFGPAGMIADLRASEPRFLAVAILMLAAMAPTAFAAIADAREFLGIDVWIKPFKFELSLAVYTLSLAFFARYLPNGTTLKRWYRVYAAAVVVAIVVEMIWIGGAAALGTASHFNQTPLGIAIFPLMGVAAVFLTSVTSVYALQIARNPSTGLAPALREAIVIGLALVLPLTLATAGTMSAFGGHFVGGTGSDAGGLPLIGWSRDGGDLRVAHFFATHAMHFIPAFGLVSTVVFGPANRLPIRLFAAAFVALVGLLLVQGLAGQPFLSWLG